MRSFVEEFQDPENEKNSNIVITIDGPSGSGKGTLARELSDILGIKHFSASKIFREEAEKRDLELEELSGTAEKDLDLAVDRRTLEKGLNNDCVIEGRIPGWILGTYSDLRVYLTAEPEERHSRIASRDNLSEDKAREKTEKRDEEDRARYREYYGIDTREKKIYDVIVDSTNYDPGQTLENVISSIKNLDNLENIKQRLKENGY